MATELAKAYVQIIPSAEGIQGNIQQALSGEADRAGKSSGNVLMTALGGAAKKAIGTLAIGKMIADGITGSGDFESGMAKVGTLFAGTDAQLQAFGADLVDMSSRFGISTATLTEAAYSAESAGVPMENLSKMLSESAKLSIAGFTDVDTALSATAKTMNAYGMTGEDAIGKVQNVLMQTQNLGITTVGELGASLANVTPTAAAMGVSFEQVGAAMAQLTASGVPTAQATTQLRAAMTELGKSGTKADKAFRAAAKGTKYAGMSFQQAQAAGADLGDVFSLMQAYADKSGKSMVDLWGSVEAGNAAMLIASDVETFGQNLDAMSSSADNVGIAYEKMAGTLNTSFARMKESAKNFLVTLFSGGDLTASFNAMLASVGDVGQKLITWLSEGVKNLGAALPGMVSGLLDFGASLLGALGNVDWISLGATIVNGLIGAMGTLHLRLIELFGNALHAITNGEIDFGAIGTAIWNGVTSIITTAGDWLGRLFEAGKKAVSGISFGEIGTAILDGVKSILTAGGEWLKSIFESGKNAVTGEGIDWSSIGTAIWTGVTSILDGSLIKGIFESGRDSAAREDMGYDSIGKAIKTAVNLVLGAGEFLGTAFQAGARLIKGINWQNVGQHIEKFVTKGLNGAGKIVDAFANAAVQLLTSIDWTAVGKGITNLVNTGLDGASALVSTFAQCAKNLLTGVEWGTIGKGISNLVNTGLDKASAIISTFAQCASNLLTGIQWGSVGTGISHLMETGLSGAAKALEGAFTAAHTFITSIDWAGAASSIQSGLGEVWTGLTGLLGGALGGAGDALSGAGSAVGDVLSAGGEVAAAGLISIKNWIQGGNDMQKAAADLKTAMADLQKALEEGAKSVKTAAENVSKAILEGIKSALTADAMKGIGNQAAVDTLTGLKDGIDSNTSTVTGQLEVMNTAMASTIEGHAWADSGKALVDGVKTGVEAQTSELLKQLTAMCADALSKMDATPWYLSGIKLVTGIADGITQKLDFMKVQVAGLALAALQKAQEAFGVDGWKTIGQDIIAKIVGGILDKVGTPLKSTISGVAGELPNSFSTSGWSSVGNNIVTGIVRGVNSTASVLYATLKNLAKRALQAAKSELGIASPSKVMADEVGRWIPAGIAEGIRQNEGVLTDALADIAGIMPDDVTGELMAQGATGEIAGPLGSSSGDDLISRITEAIRRGMEAAEIITYMDGEVVTQQVNRRIGNQLVSARYAP